jgi:hypothetical protein
MYTGHHLKHAKVDRQCQTGQKNHSRSRTEPRGPRTDLLSPYSHLFYCLISSIFVLARAYVRRPHDLLFTLHFGACAGNILALRMLMIDDETGTTTI